MDTQYFKTSDNTKIRYHYQKSKTNSQGPCFIFLNGRSEWIEKYAFLPSLLGVPDSSSYLTIDHRGQGESEGTRAWTPSYIRFADDLSELLGHLNIKEYTITAHSMGALIALIGVMEDKLHPQKMLLCSPLLGLPKDKLPLPIALKVVKVLNLVGLGKVPSMLDREVGQAFHKNKLTHSEENYNVFKDSRHRADSVTFGWVHQTSIATSYAHKDENIQKLNEIPIKMLISGDEKVVHLQDTIDWTQKAEQILSDFSSEIFHGAKHELFTESDKFRVGAVKMTQDFLGFSH